MTAILRLLFDVVLALVAPRAVLVTENLLLRQQLIVARRRVKRLRFRRSDRWLIGALAGRFRRFVEVVLLVKPARTASPENLPSSATGCLRVQSPSTGQQG